MIQYASQGCLAHHFSENFIKLVLKLFYKGTACQYAEQLHRTPGNRKINVIPAEINFYKSWITFCLWKCVIIAFDTYRVTHTPL